MSKLSNTIYDRRDNVKSLQQLFTQLVTRCPPGDSQAGLLIPLTSKQTIFMKVGKGLQIKKMVLFLEVFPASVLKF